MAGEGIARRTRRRRSRKHESCASWAWKTSSPRVRMPLGQLQRSLLFSLVRLSQPTGKNITGHGPLIVFIIVFYQQKSHSRSSIERISELVHQQLERDIFSVSCFFLSSDYLNGFYSFFLSFRIENSQRSISKCTFSFWPSTYSWNYECQRASRQIRPRTQFFLSTTKSFANGA